MEAELMDRDPLAPSVLPVKPFAFQPSTDVSSEDAVRPFGLTRARVVPRRDLLPLGDTDYDPQRQIGVTPDGTPLIESHRRNESFSPTQTQNDHQYETDQVVDD